MAVSPATAPADYGVQGPTPESVVAGLAEYLTKADAQAEWRYACEVAGVAQPPRNAAEMLEAISVLAERPGVTGICAMAMKIRAKAALRLTRSPDATQPSGAR